jgi:hypothetical protein
MGNEDGGKAKEEEKAIAGINQGTTPLKGPAS